MTVSTIVPSKPDDMADDVRRILRASSFQRAKSNYLVFSLRHDEA